MSLIGILFHANLDLENLNFFKLLFTAVSVYIIIFLFNLICVIIFNILDSILKFSRKMYSLAWIHRKKKVREFPVPSRDVITKLSLGGNNDVITELFLPMGEFG